MKNILFSTTRQWNVGDEFILFGAINIMKEVFPEGINPIIYNRHPDLRTDLLPVLDLHDIKLYAADEMSMVADATYRVGFRDNSYKRSLDGRFIDLVVFAGTPEWSNCRCLDLYQTIEQYDLPVIALGIGNCVQEEHDIISRNLNRFQLFTVRSPELIEQLRERLSIVPEYVPCPSICSAPQEMIRSIESVKRIGLVYSCDVFRSEVNNCVSTPTYEYLVKLFAEMQKAHPEYRYSLVCHYIDELPFAHSDFPDMEILYSFDAKDYYDIYNRFDMVIGARVHGIGCAAAMAIPGVCISHDFRGETAKGFLAETLRISHPVDVALETIEYSISTIEEKNKRLHRHIARTRDKYLSLVDVSSLSEKVYEGYAPALRLLTRNILEGRAPLVHSLRELAGLPNLAAEERDRCRAERDEAMAEQVRCRTERDEAVAEQARCRAERDEAMAEQVRCRAERDEAVAEQARCRAERDEAMAEQVRCRAERDEAVAEQARCRAERDEAMAEQVRCRAERDEAVAEQARCRAERDEAMAEQVRCRTERDEAVAEQARCRAERDEAVAEQARCRVERDEAMAEQARCRAERDEAVAEQARCRTERDEAVAEQARCRAKRDEMTAQRDYLLNSWSWRVTAPLRKIKGFLKRMMKGKK